MKTAHKSSILMAVWIFFSAAPTAQNSPELKIHIRNVAQDTSVYYSVIFNMLVSCDFCLVLLKVQNNLGQVQKCTLTHVQNKRFGLIKIHGIYRNRTKTNLKLHLLMNRTEKKAKHCWM